MTPDEFLACVVTQDVTRLTKVPGIGKKTAERLVFDLKDKVEATAELPGLGGENAAQPAAGSAKAQAEEALMALGYKPAEAAKLLERTATAEQSVEEMIRGALRSISR